MEPLHEYITSVDADHVPYSRSDTAGNSEAKCEVDYNIIYEANPEIATLANDGPCQSQSERRTGVGKVQTGKIIVGGASKLR